MDSNGNRRRFLRTVGLAAAALTAGCFGGDGGDGTPTLTPGGSDGGGGGTETPEPTTAANGTAANATAEATTTDGPSACAESAFEPVADDGWVQFQSNGRHTGYAPGASAIEGQVAWGRRLTGTYSEPLVSGDRLVVTDEVGVTRELDFDTGEPLWRGTGTAHAIVGETLVLTEGRRVVGLGRGRDGERDEAWGYQFDNRPGSFKAAVVGGDTAYATFSHSPGPSGSPCDPYLAVAAVDTRRGSPRWVANIDQLTCGSSPGRTVGPTVAGEFVFAGLEGDGVYGLDADDGDPNWRRVFPRPYTTPVAAGCSILVGAGESVHALDPETGESHWRYDAGAAAVAADESTAYVSTRDGRVIALDVFTGDELWTAGPFGTLAGGVAVGPERVYAATSTGGQESWVLALDADRGVLRWRVSVPGGRLAGPTLDGTRLYVGAGDPGGVHALGELPPTPTPDD